MMDSCILQNIHINISPDLILSICPIRRTINGDLGRMNAMIDSINYFI